MSTKSGFSPTRADNKSSREIDDAEIRKLLENWAASVRGKDIEGVVSRTWPESVGFYLVPALELDVPLRQSLAEWFQTFQGPIGYEIRDLKVYLGADVAFCHSLNRISGRRTNGEETKLWIHETIGPWLIVQSMNRCHSLWVAAIVPLSIWNRSFRRWPANSG